MRDLVPGRVRSLSPSRTYDHPGPAAVLPNALARLGRKLRGRPQDVIAVVTAGSLVLLRASAGATHGWRVDGRIGTWPRGDAAVAVDADFGLRVRLGPDRVLELAPAAVTPLAARIARALAPAPPAG